MQSVLVTTVIRVFIVEYLADRATIVNRPKGFIFIDRHFSLCLPLKRFLQDGSLSQRLATPGLAL